ncbi:CYTH-like domain-containing protein [Endogone sp. FLAS-F59071]|nr:CYTH-like domain-containing protein [Endogone sp. FLAS-F59071]|eukprot:RUS17512.1 CYTH-like domain-containing protein [Endogone sp. FLAS-F59071]
MEREENKSSGSGSDSGSDSASTPDIELDLDSDKESEEPTTNNDHDTHVPTKRRRLEDDDAMNQQKSNPAPEPEPEPNLEEDPFAAFDMMRPAQPPPPPPPSHAPHTSSSSLASHVPAVPSPNPYIRSPRPLELSIFNSAPADPVARRVAEFMKDHLNTTHVEVGDLDCIGLLSAGNDKWYRFESNMTMNQHSIFNKMLNDQVTRCQRHDYKGDKVRVTTDQISNKVVSIVQKVRVANLNVFSPGAPFDYRISVNVEVPVKMPTTPPNFERNKDRLSYTHQRLIKLDLTQVKGAQRANGQPPEMTHELELELLDPAEVGRERKRGPDGDRRYLEIVTMLINNVRMLNAKAGRAT